MDRYYICTRDNEIKIHSDNHIHNVAYYDRVATFGNLPEINYCDVSRVMLVDYDYDKIKRSVPLDTQITKSGDQYYADIKYVALPGSLVDVVDRFNKDKIVCLEKENKKLQDANISLRRDIINLNNEIRALNDNFNKDLEQND